MYVSQVIMLYTLNFKKKIIGPGWCGLVDWVLACKS